MPEENPLTNTVIRLLTDIEFFAMEGSEMPLRAYQVPVARAIIDSVVNKKGRTIVVIFPRQSGKNELQAMVEAFLMISMMNFDPEIVKVSPTWKPQSLNAMRRLERTLRRNVLTSDFWGKEQGFIYRLGTARVYFLSGQPTSNIVGATATALLECDEAQDVPITKWDKEVSPMAASTNATRVFWGTAWTSATLLAREKRAALEAERADGLQRVFEINADVVAGEVPAYGEYVAGQIQRFGREHPFVRTQYFSEEIEAEGGMFPAGRQALMKGDHERWEAPPGDSSDRIFAFLVDVAGEDEGAGSPLQLELWSPDLKNPARDATALTIVEVDLASLSDELVNAPVYRVRERRLWVGVSHTSLYRQIKALAELWRPAHLVIDATGVGAGLASFLERAQGNWLSGTTVIPFVFSAASKSSLGWKFLAVVETGRFKDHRTDPTSSEQAEFWRQVRHAVIEISSGPNQVIRWGVPDGTRDSSDGRLVHDDLVVSAGLCALLDEERWGGADSVILAPIDPLDGLGEVF